MSPKYVAQVQGSTISAIEIDSGQLETISPMGSDGIVYLSADGEGSVMAFWADRPNQVTGD